jgi:hypothetical protein
VRRLLRLPLIRALHRRHLLLPVVVSLVVLGVLVQGVLVRDVSMEASNQLDLSPPLSPQVGRRLDLEKTPLTYFDDYWSQLLERVQGRVVLVGPGATPAVVVMSGLALTSAEAGEAVLAELDRQRLVNPPPAVAAIGDEGPLETPRPEAAEDESGEPETIPDSLPYGLIAVDRDLGLSLFGVDTSQITRFELIPPALAMSGSYVGAVTRDRSGRAAIAPGHLVAVRAESLGPSEPSLVVSMSLSGPGATAIVNLDGGLLGVAVDRGGGGFGQRMLSSSVVIRMVAELQRQTRCRALVVSELELPVRELLGVDGGLLIEQVRAAAFIPEPSLRSGDVILEWDGAAVTTVENFEDRSDTIANGELVKYQIIRGRRRLEGGTILPGGDCRPLGDPPVQLIRYGLALRWIAQDGTETTGWRVVAIVPGGRAAKAGVALGDVVLAVNGRLTDDSDSRAVFERMERQGTPTLLTVQRADRVRILALVPEE